MGSWQPTKTRTVPQRYRGPAMTLANMRANGVRALAVHCTICRHAALLNVDRFDGSVPVLAFGPRMICTRCGIIGADARPNWTERANGESLIGRQRT